MPKYGICMSYREAERLDSDRTLVCPAKNYITAFDGTDAVVGRLVKMSKRNRLRNLMRGFGAKEPEVVVLVETNQEGEYTTPKEGIPRVKLPNGIKIERVYGSIRV